MRKIFLRSCVAFLLALPIPALLAGSDFKTAFLEQLAFNRKATNRLLDEIEKTGKADEVLAWRAAPGHAPLGWQLMHVAASEDRMAGTILSRRGLVSEKWADAFKSGKPAGGDMPSLLEVRKYLADTRASMEKSVKAFDLNRLPQKPKADAPNTFRTFFQIIQWHEPHHQGQAHATFNLFKAAKGLEAKEMEK